MVRIAMLLGQAGAGKSYIGNLLMEKDEWYGGREGDFPTYPGLERFGTSEIKEGDSRGSDWRVIDTPALGEATGTSIKNLNTIMEELKIREVHVILLVVQIETTATKTTRSLGECLKRSVEAEADIDPTRIIVLLNRIDEDTECPGYQGWLREQIGCCQRDLASPLGIRDPKGLLVIPVLRMKTEREKREGVATLKALLDAFVPKGKQQMNTKGFRTWSTVMRETQDLHEGRVAATSEAEKRRNKIQELVDSHRKKVSDCDKARGTAFAGLPCVCAAPAESALAPAVMAMTQEIQDLEKQLKECENDLLRLNVAQKKSNQVLEHLKTLEMVG